MSRPSMLILALFLASIAACAADRASGVPEVDSGRPSPDAGGRADTGGEGDEGLSDAPSDAVTDDPRLEHVSPQDIDISVSQRTTLVVRYVGRGGEPIPDAQIAFSYDEVRARGAVLATLTARTDEEGIASVQLIASPVAAEFEINVSVRGAEEVRPIDFFVTVQPKDSSDYLIRLNYESAALPLQRTEVFLFKTPGVCSAIARDPEGIFGAVDMVRILPLSDGTFDDYPYEAAREDIPLTYAVAVAYVGDAPVAFGCTDGLPSTLEPGANVVVEIWLTELYPALRGEFEVTSEFDLLEFIPGTAQQVVRRIGEFFTSPGSALFGILDDLGVFDVDDLPLGLGDLFARAIDELLFAFLPPEAVEVFRVGRDINNALQRLKLQGSMIFFEDADENGALAACNEIILDEIIVNFESFDLPALNLRSYGYQGAYGNFTGWISVADDRGANYYLNIRPFGLQINYGEIAVFILEAVVFPRVIGPSVTSMEDFVREFIDCEQIATDIGWSGIRGLCDTIIDAAVGGIRGFLTAQTADVGSFYMLATPPEGSTPPADVELLETGLTWQPCPLVVGTDSGAFQVDALGGPGLSRCVWDARFRASSTDPTGNPVPAAFEGERIGTRASGTCGDGR